MADRLIYTCSCTIFLTRSQNNEGIPENRDPGPYKNRKTGTRDHSGTLARPYKTEKMRPVTLA